MKYDIDSDFSLNFVLMSGPSSTMDALIFTSGGDNMTDAMIGSDDDDIFNSMSRRLSPAAVLPHEIISFYNLTEEDLDYWNNIMPRHANIPYYCSGRVRDVALMYRRVHGYISLIVCMFGTVANLLNVAVLTRKDMSSAPINKILTGLAVADMLVMVEYVPFAYYMYIVLPETTDYPYSWAVFLIFHMNFTQVLHTISICLTLALAVWRYIAIRFPEMSHTLCTDQRCNLAIAIGYTLPILVCTPSYFVISIRDTAVNENNEVIILYHLDISDVAKEHDELLYIINFWVYSVVVKLLPCLILTLLSCWLIKALYRANKRHQALKGYSDCNQMATPVTTGERRSLSRSERRTDRTTKMLVAVLLLFLITEFPQGILGLLSGVLGRRFFHKCYHLFGEVMDILALLNGAINFILYCSMSRQFRTTFGQLFKPRMLTKWNTASQTEVQSTYV